MKKLLFLFIVFTIMVYLFTGRWSVVKLNYESEGPKVLLDEPVWYFGWLHDKAKGVKATIDSMIDGKHSQRQQRFDNMVQK